MKSSDPTPHQREVLDHLKANPGGPILVRIPGGFWVPKGKPEPTIRDFWTNIQTVRAMEGKGLLIRVGGNPEWRDERVLTDAGSRI